MLDSGCSYQQRQRIFAPLSCRTRISYRVPRSAYNVAWLSGRIAARILLLCNLLDAKPLSGL